MLTYELPAGRIAQQPCEPRDASKLLVLSRSTGQLSHHIFRDLPDLLEPGDCLVLNNTQVIPARLLGRKADTGGKVELLLLEPQGESVYRCLGQPGKRLKPGMKILFEEDLEAEVLAIEKGTRLVRFSGEDIDKKLARLGDVP